MRISLDVNENMSIILKNMADNERITQAELLRKAIAYYLAVQKGCKNGEEPAMIKNGKIVARLIG